MEYEIIPVSLSNKNLIEEFLKNAGTSLNKFRYFFSRPVDVIRNHIATFVAVKDKKVIGYAHLDKENETIWLGIAVAESEKGKGVGKMLMDRLFSEAKLKKINKITLAVDIDNAHAISLYKKYGFTLLKEENNRFFFEAEVKDEENKIAISSLAFAGKTPEEIVSIAQKENYTLEFSSGMPYRKDMEDFFLNAKLKKIPHNYFPAPEKPFVLNLASANDEIRNRSIVHCKNGLRLASLADSPFFSAHAGFCVDPNPFELGKQLKQQTNIDKNKNWKLFISSLKEVLAEAKKYNVDFLVENNVIAQMNVYADGTNPLFCCEENEMLKMLSEVNDAHLGILLDTGHLKVSSGTLKFDLKSCLDKIKSNVKCIHHSDNDGIFDTNDPLKENYWFLNYMKYFSKSYHVLEVKNQSVEEINRQLSLLKNNL